MSGSILVTFDVVTPESAEQGDFAETGIHDDSMRPVSVSQAIKDLIHEGALEFSSSQFHAGGWYTQSEGDTDYRDGSVTRLSFHLKGFTKKQERTIYRMVESVRY